MVGLQCFLAKKLNLGEDILTEAGGCAIRRIPNNQRVSGGIKDEAMVEFPSVDLRDAVRAAAYNLAGQQAGIRLEVPHHLMNNFKALNTAAYRIKQKFPLCKRNVKFDDEINDLVLDFKTSDEDRWRKVRPQQARDMLKNDVNAVEEMSSADLSELLERGTEDNEEESI